MKPVLILGGYGNFGKRIAESLASASIPIIIAGRNIEKAVALAKTVQKNHPNTQILAEKLDAEQDLAPLLKHMQPSVVINTCGPFQGKDYRVARACIASKIHYIDLADGREFVGGITSLDAEAKKAGIQIISGASTVPGLSSAVLDHYLPEFSQIESLDFGINPGQKIRHGLATAESILTYVGRPLKAIPGDSKPRYGWQDLHCRIYPDLGRRWMANCDIPDLDLLHARYNIAHIHFSAGMGSTTMHLGIWLLSWAVRMGIIKQPEHYAASLLKLSSIFRYVGTADGGMHMIITGRNKIGEPHRREWYLIARDGDGPNIPAVPAIILAKKLVRAEMASAGATPCIGLISLAEYLHELTPFAIRSYEY